MSKLVRNEKMEETLKELSNVSDVSAGEGHTKGVATTATIAVSIALCPTTKCTNSCGTRP